MAREFLEVISWGARSVIKYSASLAEGVGRTLKHPAAIAGGCGRLLGCPAGVAGGSEGNSRCPAEIAAEEQERREQAAYYKGWQDGKQYYLEEFGGIN